MKTLPSVLNVIVEVQIDTRKPPPPPDSLLDEKGHTLLRTRAQCSPGWRGTRESLSVQILLLTGKAGQHLPLQPHPHLLYFLIYLLFSQAFFLFKGRARALSLWISLNHMPGGFVLCVRGQRRRSGVPLCGSPPYLLETGSLAELEAWLGWLASKIPGCACMHPSPPGISSHVQLLCGRWGPKLRSLCLCSRSCSQWATPSTPSSSPTKCSTFFLSVSSTPDSQAAASHNLSHCRPTQKSHRFC